MWKVLRFVPAIAYLISPCMIYSELAPAPKEAFSVVVIPDTHRYLGKGTKAQPESTNDGTNAVYEAYAQSVPGPIPTKAQDHRYCGPP